MQEHRNLILAIVLSIAILLGFQFFYARHQQDDAPQPAPSPQQVTETPLTLSTPTPALPEPASRMQIATPALHGSLNATHGILDDLTLADYHETPDPASPEIHLLAPPGSAAPYYVEFGWTAGQTDLVLPSKISIPPTGTAWTVKGGPLSPSSPVTLTWNNGAGLEFERQISVDEKYMFTVTQTVRNTSGAPVTLAPYGQIVRQGQPKTQGFMILHEGPLGVLGGKLEEYSYSNLAEDGEKVRQKTTGGWLGITDKYWLVSLVPAQDKPVTARVEHTGLAETGRYMASMTEEPVTVNPGETASSTLRVFAGAKQVHLIAAYEKQLGIQKFDLAIDFGWFYFLTKPFFYALSYLAGWLGNFGLAILAFTVLVRLALFPVANKSFTSMSRMKKLQPQLQALRERHGKDQARMSQEILALYKKEKVNPMGGCLPMLIQIPVFFALYKVLFVALEMRHAPFYGWIHDLSAPDPTSVFNLFGLIPFTPPSFLMIGAWPILMGASMFVQQMMTPTSPDPIQRRMFMFMPFMMTYLLAAFPAGLVIYWTWNNVLSIAQQWIIMRRMGVPVG
ncbi:MAG: membrane protein insertase YidC [Pseudomonadota bacterium]|nr:membrane protein insertase YidC [Pseudomonadota bacterium]